MRHPMTPLFECHGIFMMKKFSDSSGNLGYIYIMEGLYSKLYQFLFGSIILRNIYFLLNNSLTVCNKLFFRDVGLI